MKHSNIAIIGGGISGCVTALTLLKSTDLGKDNIKISLFEKRKQILKSLPYCHLHVSGVLYPDLSLSDCEQLFHESIQFAKEYKNFINIRPLIVAYKSSSKYTPASLILKLQFIRLVYSKFNAKNIFGCPTDYFHIYTREDMLFFKKNGRLPKNCYNSHTLHVENFCNLIKNIDDIQYPFISVIEPGINQMSLETHLIELLHQTKNITIHTNTEITSVNKNVAENYWTINHTSTKYDYIINSTGSHSSQLFSSSNKEYLELKSSWLIQLSLSSFLHTSSIPEIAVIGERGTDNGMIQLTPINYLPKCSDSRSQTFQIHYMSPKSSIIKLLTTNHNSINKIIVKDFLHNWESLLNQKETANRTTAASKHILETFNIHNDQIKPLNISMAGIQRTVSSSHSTRHSNVVLLPDYCEIQLIKATGISKIANKISKYMSSRL